MHNNTTPCLASSTKFFYLRVIIVSSRQSKSLVCSLEDLGLLCMPMPSITKRIKKTNKILREDRKEESCIQPDEEWTNEIQGSSGEEELMLGVQ